MAGNIYLYLDGIPGESYADDFVNWIDIDDFSIGVTMEINQDARTGGGGGTSGAADPQDLECSTKMSAATPVLLQCCAMGAIIPRAKLVQCNVINASGTKDSKNGFRVIVSEYGFGDSIIGNVSLSGSGGGIPDQSFSLNYGSIVWKYNYYRHDNPSIVKDRIQRGWSLLRNNPEQADPNAEDAMAALTGNDGGYKELFSQFTGSLEYKKQEPVDASKPSLQKWEETYL